MDKDAAGPSPEKIRLALNAYAEEMLETFRHGTGYDAYMPLHGYALFLTLPNRSSVPVSQLIKQFKGIEQSSMSRTIALLAGESKLRKENTLKLIQTAEDPLNRRYKIVSLSPEGRALRDTMHERGLKRFNQILGIGD